MSYPWPRPMVSAEFSIPSNEDALRVLRSEALLQAEKRHTDPRDELRNAIKLAEAMGWEYVRVPTWIAQLAIEALHVPIQESVAPR